MSCGRLDASAAIALRTSRETVIVFALGSLLAVSVIAETPSTRAMLRGVASVSSMVATVPNVHRAAGGLAHDDVAKLARVADQSTQDHRGILGIGHQRAGRLLELRALERLLERRDSEAARL
jgi:hypothetical protein